MTDEARGEQEGDLPTGLAKPARRPRTAAGYTRLTPSYRGSASFAVHHNSFRVSRDISSHPQQLSHRVTERLRGRFSAGGGGVSA
jgi:hypothetical protein